MYASDLTHKKRAATIFRDLQAQKKWFDSGKTIRILGQKGGNDYSYMNELQEGCVAYTCWNMEAVPLEISSGNGPVTNTYVMTPLFTGGFIDASGINFCKDINGNALYDPGNFNNLPNVIDDVYITIPMGGMDFFFFGINHASANSITWYSNNAICFASSSNQSITDIDKTFKAILLGNNDRLCSSLSSANYSVQDGMYNITKLIVRFSNSSADVSPSNLIAGGLQIRFIRETTGLQRQWIEVGVISSVPNPGYSILPPFNSEPNGDITGNLVDPTKTSPWDITDGTQFLNLVGNAYSTAFPAAGTTMVYQSDKDGYNWQFTNNAHLKI